MLSDDANNVWQERKASMSSSVKEIKAKHKNQKMRIG
jgi:hypothetical protein